MKMSSYFYSTFALSSRKCASFPLYRIQDEPLIRPDCFGAKISSPVWYRTQISRLRSQYLAAIPTYANSHLWQ